jgi:hypothetical protein
VPGEGILLCEAGHAFSATMRVIQYAGHAPG